MDSAVKIFQILFYITGSLIAILTFIKAKNGLLNSVNTEYQKRVMDRLALLSDELYEEFDPSSDRYWGKQDSAKEVIERLHEEIKPFKHEIITSKEIHVGTPTPDNFGHLTTYLDKLKSDPFIPKKIRDKVISNLEARTKSMFSAYIQEIDSYKNGLKEGKYWDSLDTNYAWIHNKINARMYENGVGISQLQEAAHDVRLAIQEHLEKFNPIK
ncbi:hypothetical protein [Pseudoalteromonas shioyasakiensis]|uniref:hypothetical protein n=1 Tax=Pseudoalteromonas shioyasakiensis TaxID=1190813 RepID=UPI001C3CE8B2|nr:hypothetical protein [Pseudoalteromonas shioyasakiensis]